MTRDGPPPTAAGDDDPPPTAAGGDDPPPSAAGGDDPRPSAAGGDGERPDPDPGGDGERPDSIVGGDGGRPDLEDGGDAASVACVTCGAVAAGALPPGWSVQTSERGRGLEHLCPTCTRTYARSIEARLAPEWW